MVVRPRRFPCPSLARPDSDRSRTRTPRRLDSLFAQETAEPFPKGVHGCAADAHTLCLDQGRFAVTAAFQQTPTGFSQPANAVPLTDLTGNFWFFDPANVELVVKVLDGCAALRLLLVLLGRPDERRGDDQRPRSRDRPVPELLEHVRNRLRADPGHERIPAPVPETRPGVSGHSRIGGESDSVAAGVRPMPIELASVLLSLALRAATPAVTVTVAVDPGRRPPRDQPADLRRQLRRRRPGRRAALARRGAGAATPRRATPGRTTSPTTRATGSSTTSSRSPTRARCPTARPPTSSSTRRAPPAASRSSPCRSSAGRRPTACAAGASRSPSTARSSRPSAR